MREREHRKADAGIVGKSMTKQAPGDDANINTIMGKFRKTGVIPNLNLKQPVYADFSEATDYLTAHNSLMAANERFFELPSRLRKACDNDPAKLIAYVNNPDNHDDLVEFGVIQPEPASVAPASEAPEVNPSPQETDE